MFQILDYASNDDPICEHCSKSAINAYLFIKMCKQNSQNLCRILLSLSECLEDKIEPSNSKSLFVSVDTSDFSNNIYYDDKHPARTSQQALKKFQSIHNNTIHSKLKIKFEFDDDSIQNTACEILEFGRTTKINEKIKKEKTFRTRSIPTSQMMFDKDSYKCKTCLKLFLSSQHLRQHYFRVHATKQFKCSECPRKYATETLLEQHKQDSHSSMVCTECGKTYVNRYSLKVHELAHKTKITCLDCGRVYKHRSSFKQHLLHNICQQKERKSNVEAKFACDHCLKRFSHKSTLRVHIQFEHGNGNKNVYVCSWCNKKFSAESRLKAHVVKHTREKKFGCDICGGNFVTKESLIYHTRIHTGEKPYQCHLCDSRFLSSSRRAEHVRRHHMSPSLECELCHRKFKRQSCLLKHKQRHSNPNTKLQCSVKPVET